MDLASIDIVEDHFNALYVDRLRSDAATVQAHGKVYLIGRFFWADTSGDPLASFLTAVEESVTAGDFFWFLQAHDDAGGVPTTGRDPLLYPGTDAAMTEAMAHRARLPVSVAERLVSLVSAAMREHLLIHHDLPAAMASDLVLQARERATVEMTWGASRDELTALVDRLHRNKRLTPTLVLRALCAGDEEFFECAMARLANIPVANARRLIQDHGDTALQRLVERCHLSHEFFTMARVALGVARDFDHDGTSADRSRVTKLIVERMASAMTEAPANENLDYLIGKLRGPDSEWERG